VALVGVLAAGAYVAFGSTSNNVVDPVAAAAIRSSDAPGYRERVTVTMSSSSGTGFTEIGTARVDPSVPAVSIRATMTFPDLPQVTQELGSNTLSFSAVLDRATMYMKLPASLMGQLSTLGKSWISVDFGKLLHVPEASSLFNGASSDPAEMLDFLRAASDSIVSEGQQVIDGVETTKYDATVDLSRVADTLPTVDQPAIQQDIAELEQQGVPTSYPVAVWVDAHKLVRRFEMTMDMTVEGQSVDMTTAADIFDYGAQPPITPPPSGDVAAVS
jgi:hypothetical protein